MRSRFTGKRLLLAAAVAGASVTAMTVTAQAAPPPAPEAQKVDDCATALDVLSDLKLLPRGAEPGRMVCVVHTETVQESYTSVIHTEHTDESGKTVESDKVLSAAEWLRGLIVRVPTVDDIVYLYTAKQS
ncbi:hypothetical protein [Actinomadura sp. WMMA1423]|uniref:hypothetical protein n=1 Tax=Actinomadura sp. WMMA1423 TaxID=2591108 RepID=UPI001146739A|nr:hypothetical protein [Actinomadura sp. WMMA1423]